MPASIFLDTNVLVYAVESNSADPGKTTVAQSLAKLSDVVISTQVLGEFYRAVTSSRRVVPLSHQEAIVWIQVWKRFDVRQVTVAHVDLALENTRRFNIGYYDALILAAARLAGCAVVFSEDLNSGQDYGGVTVRNPFK